MSANALSINPIEQQYRELVAAGRSVTKLFVANPNEEGLIFPAEILIDAYTDYFQTQTYRPDPKGLRSAREALSQYYAEHDAVVDVEQIVITAGTSESFFYLFSLLAEPGDNMLTPTPSYPLFDEIARLAHITLRPYPLVEEREWSIDCDAVRRAIDARTRAIVIVSPHNPTGMVADADTLRELTAIANAAGIPLICDEVFSEFYFGEGPFPRAMAVAKPDLCFTLNGISKMLALPALKLSWIAVTGDATRVANAVDRLEHITDTFLSCHYPIQHALPLLLKHGHDFLAQYRAEIARRRDLALSILQQSPHLRIHPPHGGFYGMAEVVDSRWTDEDACVCDLMRTHGLFPHPGYFYDYEHGIHLVISMIAEPQRLQHSFTTLCGALTQKVSGT